MFLNLVYFSQQIKYNSTKSAYISTRRYTASAHGDQEQSKRRIKKEGNEQGGEKRGERG